jgi:DNA-binding CsgD family transcriptional regulator
MQRISNADLQKISVFVRELHSLGSVDGILHHVAQGLTTLIPADTVFVPAFDSTTKRMSVVADNIGPSLEKLWPILVALRNENPALGYHLSHPRAPAFTMKDLLPPSQWKKTAVFNEFYAKLKMYERLSISLPFARPSTVGVVAHRAGAPFTGRDRTVLNLLHLHISEACRTARMHLVPPSASAMDTVEALVGVSIVVLNSNGKVGFCSELSEKHFEHFFPQEIPFYASLPPTVEKWVRREIAAIGMNELAIRPPQPLYLRLGEKSLCLRLAATRDRTGYILLLRVEDPTAELAKLNALELGPRVTEVLYWLAKGKRNEEIGIILRMAPETVKTHLKTIFHHLNVENRAAAASMTSEFLARY